MTALSTTAATFQMASSETLPLAFEMAALVGVGESVSSPTTTLTDLTSGSEYAAGLSGSPSASGTIVTQRVTGLQAGHHYRLAVSFTAAASKIWTVELQIVCLF